MSSNLYGFDSSLHRHSSSDMVSSDGGGDLRFFSDPLSFPFFNGSSFDFAPEDTNNQTQRNPLEETLYSLDLFSPSFFSVSPPSTHLENLSLYHQANRVQPMSNGPNLESEFGNFSVLDGLEVKREECQMGADYSYNRHFVPHSYSGAENVSKFFQRSFSTNSFDGKPGFLLQPHCDTLMDSPSFQSQSLSSPENSFLVGQMRRVCSTGDLQNTQVTHSPHAEGSFLEEANFKVGRYSAEERKERISKYRAKRRQRNFNKTIKYACRKTLADNRPRIRGRFARNDEGSEIPKVPCSTRDEDEDEFWIEGLNEEQEDGTVGAEQFVKSYGAPQLQYYGF